MPVLPATAPPMLAAVPVPPVTLLRRMRVTSYATPSGNTRVRFGVARSPLGMPLPRSVIATGFTRYPPLASGA